jgi:hypothetical protein
MPWKTDYPAKHRAYMREWRKAHPLTQEQRRKDNCRSYAHEYLKRGLLERLPCEVCGATAEMHHPDYGQPLFVFWLCRKHHLAFHEDLRTGNICGDTMLVFVWNGLAMVPRRPDQAAKAFEEGQIYHLEEVTERSWASHSHQFAWINQAWENLPEALADTFPTPEHLRKAALIATGWHRETVIDLGSKAAALRFAAYVRGDDAFAQVIIRGSVATVRKARSQRMHGLDRMTKAEFQKSKDDILGWISTLVGVDPIDLRGAA